MYLEVEETAVASIYDIDGGIRPRDMDNVHLKVNKDNSVKTLNRL